MYNTSYPKFTGRICAKNLHDKDKAVQYYSMGFGFI